ncbi:MAG: hypothetical protein JRN62_10050 [Nitrososphaerota archaeon]|nr:hypothetical protein [Nitrososphaerota archaeon]MDG6949806.1 hypothetical protein [Nitrososphaerota archaeon]
MKSEHALILGLVLGAVVMWGVLYVIAVQKKQQLQTQVAALQAAEPTNSALPMLQSLVNQPTCACGGVQPA